MTKPLNSQQYLQSSDDLTILRGCAGRSPAAARKRRQQPERALQVALIEHLSWRAPAGTWWTHFPAGGRRSRVTGAILKSMGAKAGVPDLLIVSHGRLYGLELKAGRNGPSSDQVETHAAMRNAGAIIGVAGDIDQAVGLLQEWGIL
jgi:hypothetical protein